MFVNSAMQVKAGIRHVQVAINQSSQAKGEVTLKDLYNIRSKIREEESGNEELGEVQALLREMTKMPHSKVKVLTHENVVHGIYFQDGAMRTQFENYPEIMLVDATYNISKENMALQTIIALDGNGESQIVALFLVNSENIRTMTGLLEIFREENPQSDHTEIIMVDKNAANLASFEEIFPAARIHLCIFHVQQIFQREITTKKLSIDEETKKEALQVLSDMVYCVSEREYNTLYQDLQTLGSNSLMRYFNGNWHAEDTRKMWVGYSVNKRTHFSNRVNNRSESFNQKLKAIICSYAPLKTFFKDLLVLVSSMKTERRIKAINTIQKQPTKKRGESEHSYQYRCFLTPFAFDHVSKQINKAVDYEFTQIDANSAHSVGQGFYIYTTTEMCNCIFFNTMILPCKHILKFYELKELEMFAPNLCHERWYKSTLEAVLQKTLQFQEFRV